MKKIVLLPILLLGLSLASCGSSEKAGTKAEFKDLKYGEALQDDEAQQVIAKAQAALRDVSSAEVTMTEYTVGDNVTAEVKTTEKLSVSSEGYVRAEMKQEVKATAQGLTFTEKHEGLQQTAFTSKEDAYYVVRYLKDDGVESLNVTALPSKAYQDYLAGQMSYTMLAGFTGALQGTKVFKVKKGYEAVATQIVESHTAVEWNDGFKELVQIDKSEVKFVINESFHITELSSIEEHHTNRDVTTGAWYDKVIVADKEVTSAKAKYDAKASDAGLASDLVAKGNGSIMQQSALEIMRGKVEGDTFNLVGYAELQPAYEIVTGINSRKLGVVVNFQQAATYNAFGILAAGYVRDDVYTAPEADYGSVAANYGNSEISYRSEEVAPGMTLDFAVLSENIIGVRALVEFEITSSPAATLLSVSNVQVTVY